ncbi:hypothetical protein FKP32DRAFT_225467 [Trametes sanguinea]|nr:hypothetical protein FKP32DRAFT_225467 [Trametes sanguinea]
MLPPSAAGSASSGVSAPADPVIAPIPGCACVDCEAALGFAGSAPSQAPTSKALRMPTQTQAQQRNASLFQLLPAPDPWSYKSAKARTVLHVQHSASSSASVQTLPTVDENSEYSRCSIRRRRRRTARARPGSQAQAHAHAQARSGLGGVRSGECCQCRVRRRRIVSPRARCGRTLCTL